jgi:hypothetical protein
MMLAAGQPSGPPAPTATYLTSSAVQNLNNVTSVTLSGLTFGAAAPDRAIIVGLSHVASGVSTLTIGGISATRVANYGSLGVFSIWIARVPTGTSGNLVVGRPTAGNMSVTVGLIRALGISNLTPEATNGASSAAVTMSTTIAAPLGGLVVAGAGRGDTSLGSLAAPTFTGMTRSWAQNPAGTSLSAGGGFIQDSAAVTHTIAANFGTIGSSFGAIAAAVWR